jgi:threonine aldolase
VAGGRALAEAMTMTRLDLRSDTVTRPTAGMRQAMAEAEVGDDVFGDDPTVARLEERVASLLGKEAALYVPSGTMSNQLALRAQTHHGQQMVCEAGAHVVRYEGGAPAALSGLLVTTVSAPDGALSWDLIEPVLNSITDLHAAPPGLVAVENTHNRAGGRVVPQALVDEIGARARARGLKVHLDGARLWNAHVAGGLPLTRLAAPADTVSVCFSKGLGAPVGSALVGPRETIARARRYRKQWGGGMRQVGILAAACLYALDHHLARLAEDHLHARRIVDELDNPRLRPLHPVDTNIVILGVRPPATAEALLAHLAGDGILAVAFGPGQVRLIPNMDVDAAGIARVIASLGAFAG